MAFQIPIDVCIIALGGNYMMTVVPIAFTAVYFTQSFFLRAARQMSLLGLDAKAPLYNHFSEMAAGIQHIRAFGWQRDFIWQCLAYLDYSQRPHYYRFCMRWWLQLSVDLAMVLIAFIVVTAAMLYPESTSPAAAGLSMFTVMTLSGRIRLFINSWAELESALGSISRIREFTETSPIEENGATGERIPDNWPRAGGITLEQVGASYKFVLTSDDTFPQSANGFIVLLIYTLHQSCTTCLFRSTQETRSALLDVLVGKDHALLLHTFLFFKLTLTLPVNSQWQIVFNANAAQISGLFRDHQD